VTSAPLAARLSVPSGPLFFPVTAYGPDGAVDLDVYRAHVRRGVEAGAAAVFACCGTGEFHALTPEEFQDCVRAAVEETAGRVPVIAGAGYGTALAVRYAKLAEEAGADGLLPETVVSLARTEGIIGFKDGVGDLDLMQRTVSAVRSEVPDDFLYFNGLPTAELTGLAYRGIGITLYSSAVFCFAPELALAFHKALNTGDDATANRLLDGFYRPFVELRAQGRGYAVSLVKAGVRLRGLDVGEVRPPLHEPSDDHVKQLAQLIERGEALLQEDK
jgi:5-dehydro-4-deoxyglucarate dehydratase